MRNPLFRVVALGIATGSLVACAEDPSPVDRPIESTGFDGSRIFRSSRGALTTPSRAARVDIVRGYLRDHRGSPGDSLHLVAQRAARDVTHVQLEQRIAGLRVHGSYVKAALGQAGEIVQLIERTAAAGSVAPAGIAEGDALAAAFAALGYEMAVPPAAGVADNRTTFAAVPGLYTPPSVERV